MVLTEVALNEDANDSALQRKAVQSDAMLVTTSNLDPCIIRFAQASISAQFRNWQSLDDTIKGLLDDEIKVDDIPPLEVVQDGNDYYSLSNRRLFVFRVMASLKKLSSVRVILMSKSSPRVTRLAISPRLGYAATKWERCFSTKNNGVEVIVSKPGSQYLQFQSSASLS